MGGGGEMVTGGTPTEMGGGGEAEKTGRGGGGERATGGSVIGRGGGGERATGGSVIGRGGGGERVTGGSTLGSDIAGSARDALDVSVDIWRNDSQCQVKSSQVLISAHSLPPLLASGAHSIGFRVVMCT